VTGWRAGYGSTHSEWEIPALQYVTSAQRVVSDRDERSHCRYQIPSGEAPETNGLGDMSEIDAEFLCDLDDFLGRRVEVYHFPAGRQSIRAGE